MIRIAVVDDVCEVCTQLEKYLLQLSDKYNQEIEVEPFYSGKSICDALWCVTYATNNTKSSKLRAF